MSKGWKEFKLPGKRDNPDSVDDPVSDADACTAAVPPPPPQAEATEKIRINSKVKKKFSFIISPKE